MNLKTQIRHIAYPEELNKLKENKKQLFYKKGESLFKQGAFAPYVMYIVEGFVRIYLQTGRDKQINIRLSRDGDFLAFSSVFDEQIYNYSAVAVTDSVICMIDKTSFKELLIQNPLFAMQLTSEIFREERHLFGIIQNISYKQMRGKLAAALIYLSGEEFSDKDVFNNLSRQDIADFASVSTESAIRFLKEFEKEGILKLKGKDIRINNKEKLIEIAERG